MDLNLFRERIKVIKTSSKLLKAGEINKLLLFEGLISHYIDKSTKRVVLSDCMKFQYPHEYHTSKKLAARDYDVIFVPRGYFKRNEKKFDVFLTRGHVFLESDLKCINSDNPDTIKQRIKEGSEQSSVVVLDIHSAIQKKELIIGLKSGCSRNNMLKQLLLFYNSQFYILSVNQILSRSIFEVIKK